MKKNGAKQRKDKKEAQGLFEDIEQPRPLPSTVKLAGADAAGKIGDGVRTGFS